MGKKSDKKGKPKKGKKRKRLKLKKECCEKPEEEMCKRCPRRARSVA